MTKNYPQRLGAIVLTAVVMWRRRAYAGAYAACFPPQVPTPAYAVQGFAYAGPCYDTTLAWDVMGGCRAAHVKNRLSECHGLGSREGR